MSAAPAFAATTYTVTTNADDAAAAPCTGTQCATLRDAVGASVAGDTINFASALNGQTITLTHGQLSITHSVTIAGPGASQLTVSGNNSSRVFVVQGDATISGLTITGGSVTGSNVEGGAIRAGPAGSSGGTLTLANDSIQLSQATGTNPAGGAVAVNSFGGFDEGLAISGSTFGNDSVSASSGFGGNGGAIVDYSAAPVTISNSTFSTDSSGTPAAPGTGGALHLEGPALITNSTFTGNTSDVGGAVAVQTVSSPTTAVTITGSTFSGNHVDGSSPNNSAGGAVWADGSLTVVNSTLTNDSANGTGGSSGFGGAIFSVRSGGGPPINLVNDTVDANTATGPSSTGGDVASDTGTAAAKVLNSIVADGTAATAGQQNCAEFETSLGHNISTGNCGFTTAGDKINTSPMLGGLGPNGGPTQTMALLPGSPAVDAGSNTGCPATDQRGVPRPQGAACDIGAYEVQASSGGSSTPTCSVSVAGKVSVAKPKGKKHKKSKPKNGSVVATVKCDRMASGSASGTLSETVKKKGKKKGKGGKKTFSLGPVSVSLGANVSSTVKLSIPTAALKALLKGAKESVTVTLSASNANGTSTAIGGPGRLHK